jgi:hypothetical protein
MDTLLVAITGASLAMALAMGGLVVKLVREERRRSDARVAALMEMAGTRDGVVPRVSAPRVAPARRTQGLQPRAVTLEAAEVPDDLDLVLSPTPPVAGVSDLFAEPPRSSPWAARAAVAAALVAVVSGVGYGLLSHGPATAPSSTGAAVPRAEAGAPLELVSLQYSSENDRLTISGLVHNPGTGATLSGIVATAFAFAGDGELLASGRAPLDFTALAPGDESPFVVTISTAGRVARYRVGFRTGDGAVIAHVDKRSLGEAVARK